MTGDPLRNATASGDNGQTHATMG